MKIPRFLPRFKGIHIVSKLLTNVLSLNFAIAITIFPFVFYKNKYLKQNARIRSHETIHIQQQFELGLVGAVVYIMICLITGFWLAFLPVLFLFYILYGIFYLRNKWLFKLDHMNSYRLIPFEREASRYENLYNYVVLRRPFAWRKFLKIHL